MKLLDVKNISCRYENHIALENVSFSVEEGDYIAIVGENGSGKSTLVKTLVGLVSPFSGEVVMNGMNAREIGYLPQSTIVQKDFPASVTEVVMTGFIGGGIRLFYSAEQKRIAKENMELLGVTPFAKKSFRELSGGQQQRVLLARALCATKKLLILDEPVSVLDPVVTHELYAIIRRLNEERGITVIMVSHDIHCAVEQARTILHLGKNVLFCGPTEDYFETALYQRMTGSCGEHEHHSHHDHDDHDDHYHAHDKEEPSHA